MKQLFFAAALALILAGSVHGAQMDLNVLGDSILGDAVGDTVTINATLTLQEATSFPAGTAALPSINFIGSLTSGFYEVAADSPGVAVGTANVGTWDATGYQGVIGGTTPADGTFTTATFGGQVDFPAGAVGAPFWAVTGSLTTGPYQTAADEIGMAVAGGNVGTWDGTGLQAVGFNGPIGTVTPAAGTFTNVDVGGTFNFGQDPADLIAGYKEIGDYISYIETFDGGSDANLAADYNIATVVGAGTNTVTVRDGWNELVTGGAGGPDSEMTRSLGLAILSEDAPRIEGVVELAVVAAGQSMHFGFWAAATRYVEIIHEPATSANWLLRVDDTAGAETEDSGVAAVQTTPTKLAITVTAGGVVDWSIDDVDMATAGITNLMTNANAHYWRFYLVDVAAAPHTAALDYVVIEKLRQQ